MARVFVPVTLGLVGEDADGSECSLCGERCYLEQWRVVVRAPKFAGGQLDVVFCGSCREAWDDLCS